MAWLWAIPVVVLLVGGAVLVVAARQLAEETTALARAAQAWRALQPAVDDVVESVAQLRDGARSLRDRPHPAVGDEGHP